MYSREIVQFEENKKEHNSIRLFNKKDYQINNSISNVNEHSKYFNQNECTINEFMNENDDSFSLNRNIDSKKTKNNGNITVVGNVNLNRLSSMNKLIQRDLACLNKKNKLFFNMRALNLILLIVVFTMTICSFDLSNNSKQNFVKATILMRVCDTREIKTVTSRVCMLFKRTKNSDVKMDRQGNMRITRGTKGDYSPAKLANDCCKIGCPPHIFANNC